MSIQKDSMGKPHEARTLEVIAQEVANGFIHRLAPAFRPPARLTCPSDEAEQVVVDTVTLVAAARGIAVEQIDLRPASAERLDAITARLNEGHDSQDCDIDSSPPVLLILRGFDVFGDENHDAPTYPFRSLFQFTQTYLWLFVGRDAARMSFLFSNYRRPLYQAAADITPEDWRPAKQLR